MHSCLGTSNTNNIAPWDHGADTLGVCKVNVATELKIAFSNAVKQHFAEHPDANDPRKYITPGKAAMKQVVMDKIHMCGSEGKL